jgi:hypothetical protein
MISDSDIQLWLETEARTQPAVIVPYVRSESSTELRYSIGLEAQGDAGSSRMSQGGKVRLQGGVAQALGRLQVSLEGVQECTVHIALAQYGQPKSTYDFPCTEILRRTKLR